MSRKHELQEKAIAAAKSLDDRRLSDVMAFIAYLITDRESHGRAAFEAAREEAATYIGNGDHIVDLAFSTYDAWVAYERFRSEQQREEKRERAKAKLVAELTEEREALKKLRGE